MIVFKFGGASVKDSKGVRNLLKIVKSYSDNLIVVVSALGKSTNALEKILDLSYTNSEECKHQLDALKEYHLGILLELFENKGHFIYKEINRLFEELNTALFKSNIKDYNCKYDQVVPYGELLSTKILSSFLNELNVKNEWVDVRRIISTDNRYREAKVDYAKTSKNAEQYFSFKKTTIYLTQGFIGADDNGLTTTLGREGSDFTAAIIANVMNAERVVVWKDVDGVLNADPKFATESLKLHKLSYQETVEMAYFGAKVIHPKTLKPLHNKNIPLHVRSFINTKDEGTVIDCFKEYDQDLPIFIVKENQVLISLFPKDLSFIIEDALSRIFKYISEQRIKVNLIQNSAISISFCIDNYNCDLKKLINHLNEDFKVLYNDQLELLTIRHYTSDAIDKVTYGREVYIEQRSRHTAHFVIK